MTSLITLLTASLPSQTVKHQQTGLKHKLLLPHINVDVVTKHLSLTTKYTSTPVKNANGNRGANQQLQQYPTWDLATLR